MSSFLLLPICVVVLQLIFIQPTVQSVTIRGTLVEVPLCDESGVRCADDCLTLLVCGQNKTTPLKTIYCPESSSNEPYCLKNKCTSSTEKCPTAAPLIFHCTESGLFPDPHDCTRYRHCDEVGITADYYQCPSGYNFNSQTGLCDDAAMCDSIDCTELENETAPEAVTFKTNPRFFAFCYNTTTTSGRIESPIFKCSANLIFSRTFGICVYHCTSAGVFEDITNCHAYFECAGSPSNLHWTRKVCPENNFFNGVECVAEHSPCSSGFTFDVKDINKSSSFNDHADATDL